MSEFKPTAEQVPLNKYFSRPYDIERSRVISSLIENSDGNNALDIGSGPGYFSSILKSKGWQVSAIEADESSARQVANYASQVYQGDAIRITNTLPQNSYKCVLALELIEHMPVTSAKELLANCYRLMAPGAQMLISTPNTLSPVGIVGLIYDKVLHKEKWTAWDKNHVHIYTSFSFISLVRSAGFQIDSVKGFWFDVTSRFPLPFHTASYFPLNRFGFNTIIKARKPL